LRLAVEILDVGLKRLPESATLYAMRGVLFAQLGELDQAALDFEHAGREGSAAANDSRTAGFRASSHQPGQSVYETRRAGAGNP
jgi:hypothetical protein